MKLFVITKKSQVGFQFVYSLKAVKSINTIFYNTTSFPFFKIQNVKTDTSVTFFTFSELMPFNLQDQQASLS